jgi:hypothetical protein
LKEQIRALLVEAEIAQFVDYKGWRIGVDPRLANQRVIDVRGQQVIEHIHGGIEKHAHIA